MIRLDPLTRRLRLWQRDGGHKAASDDLLLAWFGASAAPEARECLDLGTGKGTVAMLLSQCLPEAAILGVEAYEESYALAVRNVAENDLGGRISLRHADLRELALERRFDLVTGAPPFMPIGSGVLPRDPQRAAGRFELRGGVEAYATAGAQALAQGGLAVLLMDGAGGARAVRALERAGLHVVRIVEVLPRPARPPTYQVVVAGWSPGPMRRESFCMRGEVGEAWTAEMQRLRAALDLP